MRPDLTQDKTNDLMDAIVAQAQLQQQQSDADKTTSCCSSSLHHLLYDTLGSTGIAIGSCCAGQPPDCWKDFDAILNVHMTTIIMLAIICNWPSKKANETKPSLSTGWLWVWSFVSCMLKHDDTF